MDDEIKGTPIGGNNVRILLDDPCKEIVNADYVELEGGMIKYSRTGCSNSCIVGWFDDDRGFMGSCNNQVTFRDQNHCISSEVRSAHAFENGLCTLPNHRVNSTPQEGKFIGDFEDITDEDLIHCNFTSPIQIRSDNCGVGYYPWFECHSTAEECSGKCSLDLFGGGEPLPYVRYGLRKVGDLNDIQSGAITNSRVRFLYIPPFFYGSEDTINTINSDAFKDNGSLLGILFGDKNISIETGAFNGCNSLYAIYNGPRFFSQQEIKSKFGESVKYYNGRNINSYPL